MGEPYEVEYRLHGFDGVTRWIRERGVARTLTDGRVIMDGVALDVTRERASAEQFQRLFELSNDLILAYDRGLVIRLINPAVRSLLGYEPDEVIGREWSLLVHPDDAVRRLRAGRRRLRDGRPPSRSPPLRHEGRPHALVLLDRARTTPRTT